MGASSLQGVVKSYDPISGDGTVLTDTTLTEYELSRDALDGSVFRMLRQGQRIVFDVDDQELVVAKDRLELAVEMPPPGAERRQQALPDAVERHIMVTRHRDDRRDPGELVGERPRLDDQHPGQRRRRDDHAPASLARSSRYCP